MSSDLCPPDASQDKIEKDATISSADEPASTRGKLRGFNLGSWRISHLQTFARGGWCHNEDNVIAKSIFGLTSLYERGQHCGYRLVFRSHTFWVMR